MSTGEKSASSLSGALCGADLIVYIKNSSWERLPCASGRESRIRVVLKVFFINISFPKHFPPTNIANTATYRKQFIPRPNQYLWIEINCLHFVLSYFQVFQLLLHLSNFSNHRNTRNFECFPNRFSFTSFSGELRISLSRFGQFMSNKYFIDSSTQHKSRV